jgi:hypothetical protein
MLHLFRPPHLGRFLEESELFREGAPHPHPSFVSLPFCPCLCACARSSRGSLAVWVLPRHVVRPAALTCLS